MSTVIEMPRYGANMDEGTIASWFVSEGEEVKKGDVIAEISIEKLTNELLAPEDGTILKLVGDEGETYDCGTPIAYIGEAGESIDEEKKAPVDSGNLTLIEMPRYGANMDEGTISSWFVSEGEEVNEGDVIAEISIEKLTNELLAPVSGPIYILVEEGATVDCGTPIAKIGEGEFVNEAVVDEVEVIVEKENNEDIVAVRMSESSSKLTPKASKLASELGVDASHIEGSGYYGMVTRDDVKKAYKSGLLDKTATTTTTTNRKMTAMEKAIANGMYQSLSNTAQTTITKDMDVDRLVSFYEENKGSYKDRGVKLSYTSLLVGLVARALEEFPIMRTVISEDMFKVLGDINVGVAIDIDEGLIVPNIKDVSRKSIEEIANDLVNIVDKAKSGKLVEDDLTGGAFTITNLGMFGIKYFTPVLNLGESAILGLGSIRKEIVIDGGNLSSKNLMAFSLTHDHRVINGAPAARFLNRIQELINEL